MIRLANIHGYELKKRVFYFHNIDDCNEFMNVFKENLCKVNWVPPREIPDTTKIKNSERVLMDKDPKERAQRALDWGFSLTEKTYSVFTA